MNTLRLTTKVREWLRRYIPAEIIGTIVAVGAAWFTYSQSQSYVTAAATGWAAEGVAFYGYFIVTELIRSHATYRHHPFMKRVASAITMASTNLLIEFAPAEIIDTVIVRPFAMYLLPQLIHPYPLGFLIGKLSADVVFYVLAVLGYEARKHWLHK